MQCGSPELRLDMQERHTHGHGVLRRSRTAMPEGERLRCDRHLRRRRRAGLRMRGVIELLGPAAVALLVTACGSGRVASPLGVITPGASAPARESDRAAALEATLV